MRVVYGDNKFNVSDDANPVEVFNILKGQFTELTNGEYSTGVEAGEKVMKVTLKTGNKA